MIKRASIIIVGCLIALSTYAQTQSQADAHYKNGRYEAAAQAYKVLLASSPTDAYYTYRYARCLQELGRNEEAVLYFEQENTAKYATRSYFLGRAYFDTYRFLSAQEMLEEFVEGDNESSDFYAAAQELLEKATKLARYMRRTENLQVIDSVQIAKNNLLQAYPLSPDAGKVTADGMYINPRGDRRIYSLPNGTMLSQSKLLDQWSQPDTLPFVGYYPFLMGDGVTLYFAAEAEDGIGGLDLYLTRFNTSNNTWLQPSIVGMPYSSTSDDYLICIDETHNRGYFASTRHATADTLVTVYTFVPTDHKTYLRDSKEDEMREMALLHVITKPQQTSTSASQPQPTYSALSELTTEKPDFQYVINDSIVYQHLSDFKSAEARSLFLQWQDTQTLIASLQTQLNHQRAVYNNAPQEEQKTLAPAILQKEKNIIHLRKESAATYLRIREEEQKALI